jgi:hypothetical protein
MHYRLSICSLSFTFMNVKLRNSTWLMIITPMTTDIGSSFWGMVLIIMSPNHVTVYIAAGALILSLIVVLFVAKNVSFKLETSTLFN